MALCKHIQEDKVNEYDKKTVSKYDFKAFGQAIKKCIQIVRDQTVQEEEPRLHFWGYLSAVFRFDGIPILCLQAVIFLRSVL